MTVHRPVRGVREPERSGAGARLGTRALLAVLAVYSAAIGAYAAITPHAFYRDVVGVDLLGSYDQHLISDVGGLYLGFALLFCWAALSPGRELVRAACAAFMLTQTIHLAYHLAHLQPFTLAQAVEQIAGLLPLLLVPVAVLVVSRKAAA